MTEMCSPVKLPVIVRLCARIAHRIPLLSGLTRIAFNRVTNHVFGPKNYTILAKTQGGLSIEVDQNDYHGRILYLFGTNDPKVQAVAFELLSPGDIFLDIGANYSTIGLYASRKVGPTGLVHLFEPQPIIADRVQAAILAGGVFNTKIHRVALLDREAAMTMRVPPNHTGMATLVEHTDQSGWNTLTVSVHSISDYVGPLVRGLKFGAKIDIEGAEPQLVPWLVSQANLKFLIFEAAHNQDILFEQITRSGLTIFGLRRTIFRKEVELVRSANDLFRFHDAVAVRVLASEPVISLRGLRRLLDSSS